MSRPSVADLKKMLEEKRNSGGGGRKYNPDIYPFWQLDEGAESVVRILPGEGNEIYPFVELREHRLSVNGRQEKIPCPSMRNEPCPICELSQEYYNAEGGDSKDGKYYYRDSIHLAKAVVIEDPLPADDQTGETFEGKTVTLRLGFQLMQKINEDISRLEDDDDLPWDLENGLNFIIKCVKQGKYKKYDIGSGFSRRSSSIPEEFIDNVEIIDLDTLLPETKTYDEINGILEAHMSGGSVDPDSLDVKRKSTRETTKEAAETSARSAIARLRGKVDGGISENDEPEEATKGEDDGGESDEDAMRAIIEKVKNRHRKA